MLVCVAAPPSGQGLWPAGLIFKRLIFFKPTTQRCIFGRAVYSVELYFFKCTNMDKKYFIGRVRCIVLVSYLTPEVVSNAAALRRESLPVRRLVCWHVFKFSVSVDRGDVQQTDTPGLTAHGQAAAFFPFVAKTRHSLRLFHLNSGQRWERAQRAWWRHQRDAPANKRVAFRFATTTYTFGLER